MTRVSVTNGAVTDSWVSRTRKEQCKTTDAENEISRRPRCGSLMTTVIEYGYCPILGGSVRNPREQSHSRGAQGLIDSNARTGWFRVDSAIWIEFAVYMAILRPAPCKLAFTPSPGNLRNRLISRGIAFCFLATGLPLATVRFLNEVSLNE